MVREVCVCACEAGLCPEEAWMSDTSMWASGTEDTHTMHRTGLCPLVLKLSGVCRGGWGRPVRQLGPQT